MADRSRLAGSVIVRVLSPHEIARDERGAAHALLRSTLSELHAEAGGAIHPQDWRFVTGPHGKPSLAPEQAQAGLSFNLSHCRDLVAVAVAQALDLDVGIDVESAARDIDELAIAESYFTPAERERLRALDGSARREAFLDLWTAKEAFMKATGMGFAMPLDRFQVDLERGTCNVLDPTPQQPWVLHRWRHAGCHVALVHCGGRGGAAAPPIDFRHARLQ